MVLWQRYAYTNSNIAAIKVAFQISIQIGGFGYAKWQQSNAGGSTKITGPMLDIWKAPEVSAMHVF